MADGNLGGTLDHDELSNVTSSQHHNVRTETITIAGNSTYNTGHADGGLLMLFVGNYNEVALYALTNTYSGNHTSAVVTDTDVDSNFGTASGASTFNVYYDGSSWVIENGDAGELTFTFQWWFA